MVKVFEFIWKIKEEYNVIMREVVYMYLIKKVVEVMKLRGWY